ncbi:MAG TPA: hypothetical protein PK911_05010 [Candidatus Saccharibacteria bacterium]|nr:hypothetical protein [Candidatus Saccharibacteria bacterium]
MNSFAAITNAPVVVFSFDWAIVVQILLAVVMPLLVGLVTTRVTSGSVKAWLLAGLTLVTAVITQLGAAITSGTPFDLGLALLSTIGAFIVSVGTYYGFLKPTGIAVKAQDVEATTIVDRDAQ